MKHDNKYPVTRFDQPYPTTTGIHSRFKRYYFIATKLDHRMGDMWILDLLVHIDGSHQLILFLGVVSGHVVATRLVSVRLV